MNMNNKFNKIKNKKKFWNHKLKLLMTFNNN